MSSHKKELPPLYYAINLHYLDGKSDSARGVVDALYPDYGEYKLLTLGGVEEALATAKENGLLEVSSTRLDGNNQLEISYRITEFGKDMVRKYLL